MLQKEKLKRIPHILAGIIILLHGYEKLDEGHGPYLFYFFAGTIFLSIAIFHHKLSHRFAYVDTIFFIIEGILSFIVAAEYFEAGKSGLPWAYLVAGVMQLSAIFLFIRKTKKQHIVSKQGQAEYTTDNDAL